MTIGEFSELTGISCSALRYYEEKGLYMLNEILETEEFILIKILNGRNFYNV